MRHKKWLALMLAGALCAMAGGLALGSDDLEPEGDMESWFFAGKLSWSDFYGYLVEQGMPVTYDQALAAYQRGEITREAFDRFTGGGDGEEAHEGDYEGDYESAFYSGLVSWADFYAYILEQGMYVTDDHALTAYQRGEISRAEYERFVNRQPEEEEYEGDVEAAYNRGQISREEYDRYILENDGGVMFYATVDNPNPADRLNLRARPSASSDSLGKYYNGTVVRVLVYEDEWCYVNVEGKIGYMMTKFLNFGNGQSSVNPAERAAVLSGINDSLIAFELIFADTPLPQEQDLSAHTGDSNIRHAYYSFNHIVSMSIYDDLTTGATTFSFSVAMADLPDSVDVHDLFALFLIDCSTRLPDIRFEARAIIDWLFQNLVSGDGGSYASQTRDRYVYGLSTSHTDSEISFDVKVLP